MWAEPTLTADHWPLNMTLDLDQPRVFYDGGCPLCRREIDHYRRLDLSARIQWVDIQSEPEVLAAHGLDLASAMARFHVLGGDGRWHTGAWGFTELWSQLPYYRGLARLVRGLRVEPLLDAGYRVFARRRLAARCRDGVCATAEAP